ncbi:MAG: hypothetical protein HQL21_06290 [Candidatus Omnitrophica bacterium]|nr:hypothetical protein [Candidatus Omnitrophota bacterium]
MHYLLLGVDTALKDSQLAKIKQGAFKDTDARALDQETLDGHKLSSEKLKIALLSLPALASQRLIRISRSEKLSKENLAILEAFLSSDQDHAIVVLDAAQWGKSEAHKNILSCVQVIGREEEKGANVFDVMDCVVSARLPMALKTLNELFDQEEAPEVILGGMIWAWSNKAKGRVPSLVYKKGLLVLQEADMCLKRSKFPDRGYALEVAVVKLSSLLKA